jgi:hypothetical protein
MYYVNGKEKIGSEPKTDYVRFHEDPKERCHDCKNFRGPNGCVGPSMLKLSQQPLIKIESKGKTREARKVNFTGYCQFFERK